MRKVSVLPASKNLYNFASSPGRQGKPAFCAQRPLIIAAFLVADEQSREPTADFTLLGGDDAGRFCIARFDRGPAIRVAIRIGEAAPSTRP
jgi:hypothetical protein